MYIYGCRCLFASACFTVLLLAQVGHTSQDQSEGFFNGTAYVRLYTTLSLLGHTGLSFRTCRGGELFSQTNGPNSVSLELLADGLRFSVVMRDARYESRLNARLLDNTWRTVNLVYRLGNLTLSVAGHQQIVANSTYNPDVLNYHNLLSGDSAVLIIGKDFIGCLLEGPSIVFNSSAIQSHNVQWGQCPLNEHSCMKTDFCYNEPCMRHGECISQADHYECRCALRYSGNNCEIDNGSPCETANGSPCLNGGTCQEDIIGNYQCFCDSGHTGAHCETEISSHLCESNPCLNNGSCRVSGDKYECTCQPGFMGNNCEININECLSNPCQHGGTCIDGINNYTCSCARTGYTGVNCEKNINECENNPCLNHGICFDNYGSYTCQCTPGFDGQNCEQNLNECSSGPCRNGGHCVDLVGSYECQCIPGFTGPNCEMNINECDSNPCPFNSDCKDGIASYQCVCKSGYSGIPPNCTEVNLCLGSPCQNGGTCTENGDLMNCTCPPGFTGVYCERTLGLDWCITTPCRNGGTCMGDMCECPPHFTGRLCEETHLQCSANLCQHATNCQDYNGSYYCECEPGWMGTNCDIEINECESSPCQNFGTCIDAINTFYCECAEGFTGSMCQVNIDECASGPCQNDGVCIDHVNGYRCNCTEDFMGNNCEYEYDVCGLMPCKNNGTCHSRNKHEFTCICPTGLEGSLCELNIDDCKNVQCPENRVCVDGVNDYECRCQEGFTGENCTTKVDFCRNKPCKNDAVCENIGGAYSCICPAGFTGRNCENDIDECLNTQICNFGICLNNPGSYQCFCQPGYAGDNCDLDFDECLSGPCKNNATCENKVNSYHCICPPGFTGKDCSREINECEPNPCQNGSTCIDLIAAFSCTCPLGLTGKVCETNIDDCESSPCQNGGKCVDGINSYTCDCGDTGYNGTHCEINIDDCLNDQCQNGARCEDMVKDYRCHCYPGYTGKNCEIDVDECASNPCQYGGTCLQRSNKSLYQPMGTEPPVFAEPFSYVNASGYKCLCVPGIEGDDCEKNVNECDPNPCVAGNCVDKIGSYFCECDDGFEGQKCDIDIDECERYRPCVHGTCYDRKANYYCECDAAYGGKNCSVELIGCNNGGCLNNGTCRPYLENETEHKYNCTCTNGFHGQNCEQITTMSLSGLSYVGVNTTRDEGYDIQFRFKTTLSNGLLAIGKGPTYYILELVQGRLNLHSSLLNKWEGVYIGSGLNDSNWQKVFVAINSSHLVLAANEEQTIYPINLNEGANASHTSFPTTYLGGTAAYLRRLAHGPPSLVGCVQDVVINAEWVVPSISQPQVTRENIEVGCPREPQCRPNPCHNGGHCKDLWRNFSCTCERPFLGHTCQYNLTAATFGNENVTSSMVEVRVNEMARRAVQNIVDISMFIRTRKPRGTIFYMGSVPGSVPLPEETLIAAQLEGGELSVRIQFNNTPESYTVGGLKLADGYYHLIQVVRNVTLVQVKINGTEYFRKTISAMGQLNVQVLYLGGMPSNARHIRQVEPTASRLDSLMTQPGFKGIIQDVQISNGSRIMVVEFFELKVEDLVLPPSFGDVYFDEKTVLKGVVSDDTCSGDPCQHNGTCFITWNDFGCKCPPGYKGKMCQEMEFCQLQKCPKGSSCQNLDDGYECIANVTFDGHNMSLNYALNFPDGNLLQLDSIKIVYRSHTGGTIMFISSSGGTEYFSVSVFNDEVTIAWNLDGAIGPSLSLHGNIRRFHKAVPDGKWSTIEIRMRDGDIMGGFQGATDEEAQFSAKNFSLDLWHQLIRSGKITLGGISDINSNGYGDGVSLTHKHSYVTYEEPDAEHSVTAINGIAADFPGPSPVITTELPMHNVEGMYFKGCLGEVRIGGLLLPYFTPEQLNPENYTTQDSFHLSGPPDGAAFGLDVGCVLCFEHECKNGGHCADPAEQYNCNCSAGFQGDDCGEQIDECKQHECKNGATCIDLIANYSCQCPLGWEGRFCEIDIDECASNPCQNGGLCINGMGRFECNCTSEFVGLQCENVKLITCDSSPCANGSTCTDVKNPKTGNNFTCICMEGYVEPDCSTPYCFKDPCQHNGECVILNQVPMCRCVLGYTGRFCEEDINDCVDANNASRCQNGGICTDGINNYTCDCSNTGYTGRDCTEDIDECAFGLADCGLGRCQNLPGRFRCECPGTKCGPRCAFNNTCELQSNPCENGGTCIEECNSGPGHYTCECPTGYGGQNCTETNVETASNSSGLDIALIIAPIVGMILIASLIGLTIFITMARKKRATRGTYSPSQQEYCNPRVEMDNVMKPPPEERLI